MKLTWRDTLATLLAIAGSIVVFARLQSYSWWLIGSWKGALGVVSVIGLTILATYIVDWFKNETLGVMTEMILWLAAAAVVVSSLLAATTKAQFVWSSGLIGLAWLAQLGAHTWDSTHSHKTHYVHTH